MGLSLHYKGGIDPGQIAPLCEELRDIAGSVGWNFIDVDDDEKGLRGIILQPSSDMESVPFLFDARGRVHALCDLILGWQEGDFLGAAVKTQFVGCPEHIWLCGLLRHIQRTYMPELTVTDEGGFWETGDAQELQHRMDLLDRMINEFGSALESASMDTVLDPNNPDAIADFVQRIAEHFRKSKE
ncbi:MAG: hypothetical protein PHP44_12785 [Kiritimatiellae bacterium]|nr:hypothetical protein [Kiritimatiellia bacterium]MDD4736967.1 hypothetical protein [Kiritimatiellia bacterium]